MPHDNLLHAKRLAAEAVTLFLAAEIGGEPAIFQGVLECGCWMKVVLQRVTDRDSLLRVVRKG